MGNVFKKTLPKKAGGAGISSIFSDAKESTYLDLPVWVPNGSSRVSIHHPLGSNSPSLWKVLV